MGCAATLVNFIQRNGWTRGVLLGVGNGDLLLHLIVVCPYLRIIAVDKWEPIDTGSHHHEAEVRRQSVQFGDRIQIIQMDTAEAAALVSPRSQNFVVIAEHPHPDRVLRDHNAWIDRLMPSGAMFGHGGLETKEARTAVAPMITGLEGGLWFKPIPELPPPRLPRK